MKKWFQKGGLLVILILISLSARAQTHYKVILIQAAPGSLEKLIKQMKVELVQYHKIAEEDAYLIRHSQGDSWDLMLLAPIGSLAGYFESEKKDILEHPFGSHYYDLMTKHEDAFVFGPDLSTFHDYFSENNFFHVEMFVSLPGKQEKLKEEREMENEYLINTNRKPNLVFLKFNGFKWDIFTVGAYENIQQFAGGASAPVSVQEAAAKKAGFKSAGDMGFYLRELVSEHRDTFCNKVVLE